MRLPRYNDPERIARHTERARGLYREVMGTEAEARRAQQIAALPTKEWRGQALWVIRCQGHTGRGPHDYAVPEAMLWSLMDLGRFTCPWHSR